MNDQRRPDEGDELPSARRPMFTEREYKTVLDRQIVAGQANGAFSNLPGAGQPLVDDHDACVPEDVRVGYRMLKTAGFAPSWLERQKEIRSEQEQLGHWLQSAKLRWHHASPAERERLRGLYREKLITLNRAILNYNLSVPQTIGQMAGLRFEDEVAKLG